MVDTMVQCKTVYDKGEVIFGQNKVNFVKILQRKREWEEGEGKHANGTITQTGADDIKYQKKNKGVQTERTKKRRRKNNK